MPKPNSKPQLIAGDHTVTDPGETRTWARSHGTREALMARLTYEPQTGVFTWRNRKGDDPKIRTWNTRYGGRPAGSVNQNGYVQIHVEGRIVYAHRLAWLFVHGEWPPDEIDHHNTIPGDNRIENLRPATRLENLGNRKRLVTNRTGHKGVCARAGKFWATITIDGKQKNLGLFTTAEEAAFAYQAAAKVRFGSFSRGV